MEKKYYIQPSIETMVLPEDALMDKIMEGLAGTPTAGEPQSNGAPQRQTPVF